MNLYYSKANFRLLYKSLKEILPDWEHNAREQDADGPMFVPWRRGLKRRAEKALAKAEGRNE